MNMAKELLALIRDYEPDSRVLELGHQPHPGDSEELVKLYRKLVADHSFPHPVFKLIKDDYIAYLCYWANYEGLSSENFSGRQEDEIWLVPMNEFGTHIFSDGSERLVGLTRPMSLEEASFQRNLFFDVTRNLNVETSSLVRSRALASASIAALSLGLGTSLASSYQASANNDFVYALMFCLGIFSALAIRDIGRSIYTVEQKYDSKILENINFRIFRVPKKCLEYIVNERI